MAWKCAALVVGCLIAFLLPGQVMVVVKHRSSGTPGFAAPHSSSNSASATGTGSLPVTVTSVATGDLVVANVKWEGSDTTVSVSDGSSTFVDARAGAHSCIGGYCTTIVYSLSSAASGSVTYNPSWTATQTFRTVIVCVFHPNSAATIVRDGIAVSAASTGTAIASGNITTTGTDGIAVGAYGDFGPTLSSVTINGAALTGTVFSGSSIGSRIDYKTYTAGFTGQYAATYSSNTENWAVAFVAFKR